MPRIHVSPLSRIASTVEATGASHLVSLINDGTPVERPASIPAERHLFLGISDVVAPTEGMITPATEHVRALLDFVAAWDRRQPMLIHCYAGISRSTAAAFIALCAVGPERAESEIAERLRAAAPSATPNALLVGLADNLLDRRGRMVAAVAAIGRGEMAYEGVPFGLGIDGED
ncbi:MAG: tyrosine phosphatase family protein [Bauldia sp.]